MGSFPETYDDPKSENNSEKLNGRWLMTPLHFASHNDNSDHASIVKSKYFVLFK